MNKKIITNIFLSIVLGYTMNYVYCKMLQTDFLALCANNFCNESTTYFQIDNSGYGSYSELYQDFDVVCLNGDMIQANLNSDTYAVYYKNTPTLPMLYGNFFIDRSEQHKNIVLGKNYVSLIEYDEGIPYFTFNNTLYYVCGIIGLEYASPLDKNMYFLLTEEEKWIDSNTVYSINNEMVTNMDWCVIYSQSLPSYIDILGFDIYVGIFIIVFITLLFVAYFQVNDLADYKRIKINIMFVLGYSKRRVLYNILKTYMISCYVCFMFGGIISFAVYNKQYYDYNYFNVLVLLCCILLINIIYLYLKLKKTFKEFKNG